MNKLELFVAGCKAERWRYRTWRSSLFSVTSLPEGADLVQYDIDYKPDGAYWYTGTEWAKVKDHNVFEALYDNRALANFPAESVPNHPEPIQTTYGRMLYNWMIICYSFGVKVPFQHLTTQRKVVSTYLTNIVDDDFEVPSGGSSTVYITASEVSRFVQASNEITSICGLISPTGTDKSLTTDPNVKAKREELLKKHKGPLTPNDIVHVQNELVAMDKKWLSDDDAADFYLSGSAYKVKRKKLYLMHGMETAFQEGSEFDFIPTSLSEGGDLSKITAKNNATREGSFDRGNDTALGGAKVVFLQRVHQNTQILDEDCGALAQPVLITEYNRSHYIGMNIVVGGKVVSFTEVLANASLNKIVNLRRPILCKCAAPNYCAACTSLKLAAQPRAIISEIAAVASHIMLAFMSSMHGTELKLSRFNFKHHIK